MKKRKQNPFRKNKYEIFYNIINAGLSGVLILLGAWSSGGLHLSSFIVAGVTALIVFAGKFKDYWDGEKSEYATKVFHFIG